MTSNLLRWERYNKGRDEFWLLDLNGDNWILQTNSAWFDQMKDATV